MIILELYLIAPIRHKILVLIPFFVDFAVIVADLFGANLIYSYTPEHAFLSGKLHSLPVWILCIYMIQLFWYSLDILHKEEYSKAMRSQPTEAEKALWELLRGKKTGFKFRRQHIVGDFIVDFLCLEKHLIIEVDGGYHNDPQVAENDELRSEILELQGYTILRFTNEQVLFDTEKTLSTINHTLKSLPTGEVSEKLGRGKHTTRHCEIKEYNDFKIIDTPGFSCLKFDGTKVNFKQEQCKFFT